MIKEQPPADPFEIFAAWFEEAKESEPNDPNAMSLASVGEDGMPSLRMVLLKGWDERGFVFYTNYQSRKGRQILALPKAALLFHWKSRRRQVRAPTRPQIVYLYIANFRRRNVLRRCSVVPKYCVVHFQ